MFKQYILSEEADSIQNVCNEEQPSYFEMWKMAGLIWSGASLNFFLTSYM
jgi:hypothetical protein